MVSMFNMSSATNIMLWFMILMMMIMNSSSEVVQDPQLEYNNNNNNDDNIGAVFTYYSFVLQWIPTSCWEGLSCGGYTGDFSIHGLWPAGLRDCSSEKLNLDNIKAIQDRLYKLWPHRSGFEDRARTLWAEQWTAHGTCSGLTQFNYFNTALALRDQLGNIKSGIGGTIEAGNDNSYKKADYIKAFSTFLKKISGKTTEVRPFLSCVEKNGKWYLSEVRPCYTNANPPQLQDCTNWNGGQCPAANIYFPASAPPPPPAPSRPPPPPPPRLRTAASPSFTFFGWD